MYTAGPLFAYLSVIPHRNFDLTIWTIALLLVRSYNNNYCLYGSVVLVKILHAIIYINVARR
jgi:hypothetical protein